VAAAAQLFTLPGTLPHWQSVIVTPPSPVQSASACEQKLQPPPPPLSSPQPDATSKLAETKNTIKNLRIFKNPRAR
jgi:hypothetical protein